MSIFGEASQKLNVELKNPNVLREAFMYEYFKNDKLKSSKFIKSREAQVMIEEGIITHDLLDRLAAEAELNRDVELTVCHMAQENDDPEWKELVATRAQERRLMNDLMEKYNEAATLKVANLKSKFLGSDLPQEFK